MLNGFLGLLFPEKEPGPMLNAALGLLLPENWVYPDGPAPLPAIGIPPLFLILELMLPPP